MSGVTFCTVGCNNGIDGGGGGGGGETCRSDTTSSHVRRVTGAGNFTIPAFTAASVTLNVIGGDVSVVIGAEAAVLVPAGMSLSWGVTSCAQILAESFSFTNSSGGDDFVLNWTV